MPRTASRTARGSGTRVTESTRDRLRIAQAFDGFLDRFLPGNSRATEIIYGIVNVIGELREDPPAGQRPAVQLTSQSIEKALARVGASHPRPLEPTRTPNQSRDLDAASSQPAREPRGRRAKTARRHDDDGH